MSSNQRPDTLMQDRITQIDEIFLHRTAGPYIGSFSTDPGGFESWSMSVPPRKRT